MAGFAFHNPVALRFGRGVIGGLLDALPRPLLLVGGRAGLERSGLAHALGVSDQVYAHVGVRPNPGAAAVEAIAVAAARVDARCLVGVGGGSVLDATKTAAALLGNADDVAGLLRLCSSGAALTRRVRSVAVPTTAGTGSEVTRWASLWSDAGEKRSFDHEAGYADEAWVDPALSDGMDVRLTAATGLDAVAHAMEAIWSVHGNPLSDVHARAALGLARAHLVPAIAAAGRGERHMTARDGMALAALHAGLALSGTRSAAAHAFSYALTGRHGLEHGLAVGLLCGALLPVNARLVPARVALILDALGVPDVAGARDWIHGAFSAAGLSPSLAAFGIPVAALPAVVASADDGERLANNPGPVAAAEWLAALESVA